MKTTFKTEVAAFGNNTGIVVPESNIEALGKGKRPPVTVTIGTYSYKSTVAVMSGQFLIPLAKEHRTKAGLSAGDRITVILELDDGPRAVDVPEVLAAALKKAGLTDKFEKMAYSHRKEFVRAVNDAKADATKQRRVDKIIEQLSS